MNRSLLCLLTFIILLRAGAADSARPNFIFIYADDMRWDAMSVVQAEQGEAARFPWMKTPNLDRLAAEGIRFRNAFAATAVCSPSRAEFLTGRYSHFNGVASNQTHFPRENATWATGLKSAGYATAYVGKWHRGNQKERPGFDYFASFTGQGRYEDWFFEIDGVRTATTGWVDDVSTDFAIEYLERDHLQPFAIALGFKTPHIPFIPPARAKNRFLGKKVGLAPNFNDPAIFIPPPADGADPTPRAEQPLWALDYFQCISAIDENVGRILAVLEAEGLAENTVVVFSSDNGYFMGEHGLGDFMGDKRSAYEEAMRIPLIVRYPPAHASGTTSDALVLNIDLAPTLLGLAGETVPNEIQGKSWQPLLADASAEVRTAFFYEYFFENKFAETPTILALRTKDAKIVKYPDHPAWTELFDLRTDPFERQNLAYSPQHRSLLERMEATFQSEKQAVGYVFPDYAEEPWPDDYIHVKKTQNYPWLNR